MFKHRTWSDESAPGIAFTFDRDEHCLKGSIELPPVLCRLRSVGHYQWVLADEGDAPQEFTAKTAPCKIIIALNRGIFGQGKQEMPAPAQQAALRLMLADKAAWARGARAALRAELTKMLEDPDRSRVWQQPDAQGFIAIRASAVTILADETGGLAWVGMLLRPALDDEHGSALLIHRDHPPQLHYDTEMIVDQPTPAGSAPGSAGLDYTEAFAKVMRDAGFNTTVTPAAPQFDLNQMLSKPRAWRDNSSHLRLAAMLTLEPIKCSVPDFLNGFQFDQKAMAITGKAALAPISCTLQKAASGAWEVVDEPARTEAEPRPTKVSIELAGGSSIGESQIVAARYLLGLGSSLATLAGPAIRAGLANYLGAKHPGVLYLSPPAAASGQIKLSLAQVVITSAQVGGVSYVALRFTPWLHVACGPIVVLHPNKPAEMRWAGQAVDLTNVNDTQYIYGPDGSIDGQLLSAVVNDKPPVVRELVAAGANVNGVEGGRRPLVMAFEGKPMAMGGNLPMARLLLELGADPTLIDSEKKRSALDVTEGTSKGSKALSMLGLNVGTLGKMLSGSPKEYDEVLTLMRQAAARKA